MVDKDEILRAIRLQAAQNGGAPLGKDKFAKTSGIRESTWYGKYWANWNDLIIEAGFEPKAWDVRVHQEDELVPITALSLSTLAIGSSNYVF